MTTIPPAVPPISPVVSTTDPIEQTRRDDPTVTLRSDVINWDAVAKAHVRTVDAAAGFDKMVEKAEPRFRPVAERFLALHQRHAMILAQMLAEAGQVPDTDGSFMGTVNRAVISTRALFDEVDEDTMDEVRRGEKTIVRAYEEALEQPLPKHMSDAVAQMLSELNDMLAQTRHLD